MSLGPEHPPERGYQFGPFLFDPLRRLLLKDGRVVPTTSKTLEILRILIEHRDRIVTKDEFIRDIWGETVVEEGTLVRHLSSLRKAMGLAPGQHDYIVTVSGHGYRFVAKVTELEEIPPLLPTSAEPGVSVDAVVAAPALVSADPSGRPGSGRRAASRRLLVRVTLVAATLFLALAALIFWETRQSDGASATNDPPSPNALRRVTFGPGSQFEPTWSPDGKLLAYTSDRSGTLDVWVQSLTEAEPTRLSRSDANDWQPDWSPDGHWIAFRSERDGGGIYVVSARGGNERRLSSFGYRPTWSRDSSKVLFTTSMLNTGAVARAFVVGLDDRAPQPVLDDLTSEFGWSTLRFAWHPDGKRVSMWGRHQIKGWRFVTASLSGQQVVVSSQSAQVEERIRDLGVALRRFTWDKTGRYLYFEGRTRGVLNLWRVEVEPAGMQWIAGPDRLTVGPGDDADFALAADGRSIAFASRKGQTRVWSFPLDGTTGRLAGPGAAMTPGGSDEQGPDAPLLGGKLLYRASLGLQHELREISLRDGRERLLLRGRSGSNRTNVRWSPDGTRIAYDVRFEAANGTASSAAAVLSTHDDTEQLLTTPGARQWTTFGWSPDGRAIVGSCRPSPTELLAACLLPISSAPNAERDVRVIASSKDADFFQEQFSPDGQRLLFMAVPRYQGGVSTINVMPAIGGAWIAVTDGQAFEDKPRWAPNGRTIYFLSNRDGSLNIWARRFDPIVGQPVGPSFRVTSFDTPKQMLSTDSLNSIEIAVLADRLVLPVTESSAEIWVLDRVR